MAPAIIHNLPVLQLMCHLTAPGSPATNITGSGVNLQLPALQLPHQYQPAPLPDGYVAHSDIGVAYKIHQESVTWVEARILCEQEGAQLALIDSFAKLNRVMSQRRSPGAIHVGIIRMYDDTQWVGVTTGSALSSLPWAPNEPWGEQDCVMITGEGSGLVNNSCDVKCDYVCEIPNIDEDNTTDDYPQMPIS